MTSAKGSEHLNEPQWTDFETERFWRVMEPYIRGLISCSIVKQTDINFSDLDPNSRNELDVCLGEVQKLLWSGKYTQAVYNLRAIQSFFNDPILGEYGTTSNQDTLSILKAIFTRKLPPRRASLVQMHCKASSI
ncbi:unnamed protein product [Owenia fusiformis]|uniref:Uncharacterized protein n=1 Tax=Owenia fusiformis TaxID=6347 RepID=A0A8J1Y334_OWEFU|nr:unnamed protein product [Owenia fusiformis]